MGAEKWIDAITKLWATVDDGKGRKVRSYSVFERDEFPDALSEFPCAITYIQRVPVVQYSAGGPAVVVYRGVSEFHLTQSVSKKQMPYVIRFYERIIKAAASKVTLGGLVSHFVLTDADPLVPGVLVYGSEEPHFGIVANWIVKENPVIVVEA